MTVARRIAGCDLRQRANVAVHGPLIIEGRERGWRVERRSVRIGCALLACLVRLHRRRVCH